MQEKALGRNETDGVHIWPLVQSVAIMRIIACIQTCKSLHVASWIELQSFALVHPTAH